MCAMEPRLRVEKISPQARLELGTARSTGIGVGRFRILGGPREGQIPSRHMTS